VAKLAGVPGETVRRAKGYLARLDKFNAAGHAQADLFAAPAGAATGVATATEEDAAARALRERIAEIDPDTLAPRDALALLYELKRAAGS
jgi:DNA mismatch repair protein MutS